MNGDFNTEGTEDAEKTRSGENDLTQAIGRGYEEHRLKPVPLKAATENYIL